MTPQEIKALIDAMAASDLAEMEFSREGATLRLVRQGAGASPVRAAVASPAISAPSGPAHITRVPTQASAPELTAPLYGVVHWRPGPEEALFVTPGQAVAVGQVVCVIEAMKVFNEVRSERAGTVASLLAESGQEVDAGQPLLRWA